MKHWFRNSPIRRKLMVVILSTSSIVLFVTCAAFVLYGLSNSRPSMVRSLSTVAKIIAANSTAALAFDNRADAGEVLAALASDPGVAAASLYRTDGTLIARYPESLPAEAFPPFPGPDGHRFDQGRLLAFQPVIQGENERVGSLYIETQAFPLAKRLRGYAVIILFVMAIAGAVSYIVARALQGTISEPILALSETARRVSDSHDYSARAERVDGGELGQLTDAFNIMLAQIQQQNGSLALSEQRHRLLFENSPLPMWVYDLETRRFLAANEAASLAYGFSNEEFLAMSIEDIRPPEEVAALRQYIAETPPTLTFRSPRVWKHRKKDGTLVLVEITSHDLTFDGRHARLVLANEVTARVRAESELRESEGRIRAILDSAPNAVVVTTAAGDILEWNPRAESMFGRTRDEARGRNLGALIFTPADRERNRNGLQQFLQNGDGPALDRPIERKALRRDGSEFPVEVSISPLRAGGTITVCAFITDITERKQAEAEIRQLNEDLEKRIEQRTAQLEGANRELESFSYSVSHDLRAPLRHVQGYVALLERATEGQLSAKAQRQLKVITDASVEMGQLIDDLLEFSRMGRTEMRAGRVKLDTLVQSSVEHLELVLRGRNIAWKIAPLPPVIGDSAMLRQVLGNLVGNAVKYTRQRDPAEIEIGTAGKEDGRVIVFVRDNGAGFDMTYAHKLFGVFQRLHRSEEFEGTGIGLATVSRVIARHGGRVWAEGEVGKGATFYFTVQPAADTSLEKIHIENDPSQTHPPR